MEVERPKNNRTSKWLVRGLIALVGIAVMVVLGSILFSSGGVTASANTAVRVTHKVKRSNLSVTVVEQGVLESSENTEIKCMVRGQNTVNWVIENGTIVKPGDVLVRLDTLVIEDAINERSKYAHWSRSAADGSEARVARSKLAIKEYEEGRFVTQLMEFEKQLAMAESNLLVAKSVVDHSKKLASKGFINQRDFERKTFQMDQAKLDLEARKTDIEVLKKYTKAIQLETLNGNLKAAEATHDANVERAVLDETRRDQAKEELADCIIEAEKSGLVIYPSSAAWKETPDVAEGATVHKNQVLLLMPDLNKMQVKVGVHESIVDRIREGLVAKITLPEISFEGKVESVAAVARPAGWWTGGIVKYDTVIKLPQREGLKPGMSAEVEIVVARYEDVLTLPVSAILETDTETLCWVATPNGSRRSPVTLGDSNDIFVVVEDGLEEGDEVILNPLAFVQEAQAEALTSMGEDSAEEGPQEAESEKARTGKGVTNDSASGGADVPASKPRPSVNSRNEKAS